jgi:hypothetical protein
MIRLAILVFGLWAGSVQAETVGPLHTPAKGSEERAQIMDAARVPVVAEIGQPVVFVVDILNSDGTWAYLNGRPQNPDGSEIDYANTPLADAMAMGIMSREVMVLLHHEGKGWVVVEYFMGPTDVAWYGWIDTYGLPERLFRS